MLARAGLKRDGLYRHVNLTNSAASLLCIVYTCIRTEERR